MEKGKTNKLEWYTLDKYLFHDNNDCEEDHIESPEEDVEYGVVELSE